MRRQRRERLYALFGLVVALLAGVVVALLATNLFPYHSVNDDEGVALLQAAMLLKGQMFLHPGQLADVVRPWSFVVADAPAELGGVKMYGKASPVISALFALSKASTGEFDVVLSVVAFGTTALVYGIAAQAFDRETGVLSALLLLGSPLFLVTSATFLPYAPTTLFALLFGFSYVRATRRESLSWSLLSGTAIGVAFFARPSTGVLFALPFLAHSLMSLWRARKGARFEAVLRRYLAIAVPGLAVVVLALVYNAVVTGDPFVFPYAAFAPDDGLRLGHRESLGAEQSYTPALAVETTGRLLWLFATKWTTAGLVGTLAFVVGLGVSLRRALTRRGPARRPSPLSKRGRAAAKMPEREVQLVLAAVVVSVVLGNAFFWGTLDSLQNGLVRLLGPFYYFDLLLPLSAFAAAGILTTARTLRRESRARFSPAEVRGVLLLALVVSVPVAATTEMQVLSDPFAENGQRTANLASTYEPIVETEFDDAVVFLPTPYGDWQQHPFQYLRNDPGFDGEVLYVLDEEPERDFETLGLTENRTPYRFTYRGEWTGAVDPVTPQLQQLDVLEGQRVNATSTLGVPARASNATVRIETVEGDARYDVADVNPNGTVTAEWTVGPDDARVTNLPAATANEAVRLPAGASEVDLVVTFVTQSGATVTYRQEATVEVSDERVRVVWPPETRVCRSTTECGTEGTYVGPEGDYVSGVSVETEARVVNETA
ncbi:Dolichyl-phosphate-mannose-protein mannosyltransferase [Halogranum rubrum]|uniref:Dolichyl-phosphate-mannose-protein mannosyltransferase n=1 Tax=Halogranum rubrum TaxID=553466 RepID=A0A1I4IAS3_9EURY|nr:glycosyltransferase family 39 protein [Halogranum rubrum]SFL51133.1 Dolichyl-phosphate-mannose-protein mannosyltransferase [Halogranum rubrum]